ncbi:hypothetical protein MMC06_000549 [Schaereria dolodes]|nr:hypothetical protein [Schaereria dolodes]
MSGSIQAQADVGTLSLQGLGAFTSVLATLSADNVMPMAMVQMERLGAMFPTNGEYAEKTKSLLQRCCDVRLNRLLLVVGWRKNDSSSLMGESAGGQAIALLSMCLSNLCAPSETGKILSRLSARFLSDSMNVASIPQLADVADLLSGKLQVLGFGNLLAREVTKIHRVYAALGNPAPTDLLELPNIEVMMELLEPISQALCDDEKICRISGSCWMGHIFGLLQALFPRTTVVTIEGTVIQDVESPKIYCEVKWRPGGEPTQIRVETSISTTIPIKLPITVPMIDMKYHIRAECWYFHWSGCLADWLQLRFLDFGFNCDQAVLDACCNVAMLIPAKLPTNWVVRKSTIRRLPLPPPLPPLKLLGPVPRARMSKICEVVWRSRPTMDVMDMGTAFANLITAFHGSIRGLSCTCWQRFHCNLTVGWVESRDKQQDIVKRNDCCVMYELWIAIGRGLLFGFASFFIDAGQNAVVAPGATNFHDWMPWLTTAVITKPKFRYVISYERRIMDLIFKFSTSSGNGIVRSSTSSTIFPTILETLSVPAYQSVTFTLVEGRITYRNKYFTMVSSRKGSRPRANRSLQQNEIRPSHIGVQTSDPLLTIQEEFGDCDDALESDGSISFLRELLLLCVAEILLS